MRSVIVFSLLLSTMCYATLEDEMNYLKETLSEVEIEDSVKTVNSGLEKIEVDNESMEEISRLLDEIEKDEAKEKLSKKRSR